MSDRDIELLEKQRLGETPKNPDPTYDEMKDEEYGDEDEDEDEDDEDEDEEDDE